MPEPTDTIRRIDSEYPMTLAQVRRAAEVLDRYTRTGSVEVFRARLRVAELLEAGQPAQPPATDTEGIETSPNFARTRWLLVAGMVLSLAAVVGASALLGRPPGPELEFPDDATWVVESVERERLDAYVNDRWTDLYDYWANERSWGFKHDRVVITSFADRRVERVYGVEVASVSLTEITADVEICFIENNAPADCSIDRRVYVQELEGQESAQWFRRS